jgi:CheY-like chemotaxis protein
MEPSEKRRILVVEPDPAIRALVVALLHRSGYATDAVANADAALQARRGTAHGAVVIDPRIPGGDRLLAALRTDPEIHENVIIMTTPDWREPAYASGDGVRGVLRKPFFLQELATLVAACFNDGAGDPTARGGNRDRLAPIASRNSA